VNASSHNNDIKDAIAPEGIDDLRTRNGISASFKMKGARIYTHDRTFPWYLGVTISDITPITLPNPALKVRPKSPMN
jgi:hypothetical protein